ncbi:MAG: DUF2207 domain-containing protein [Armatimonadota bacterium]|nr:DUF2207 domain-containing protein [Armatimonadota bacterium]
MHRHLFISLAQLHSAGCKPHRVRNLSVFFAGLVFLSSLVVSAWAFPISDFQIRVEVCEDSSINVTETITADFRNEPHHGIYRVIPLLGKDSWGNNYRLRVYNVRVTDLSGRALNVLRRFQDGSLYLRIGDPDVYVSGLQTYVISYTVWRAIHFFSDHDELYWNAVGTEWEVPILKAWCDVVIPDDVSPAELRIACYAGYFGSTGSMKASSDKPGPSKARFWSTRPFSPGEGMTIVVGWPKGIVKPPSFKQECVWFVTDNGYFLLVPAFCLGLFLYWRRVGADPDVGRSVVVTYEPPDNLSPAQLGTLIDERVDMRDISASIVDLAVRGYLRIKETVNRGFLWSARDYTLELTKSFEEVINDPALSPFETALIQALFGGKSFCVISNLKHEFYVHIPKLKKMLYNSLVKKRYFTQSPESIRKSYAIAGAVTVGVGVFITFLVLTGSPVGFSVGWGIAIALCGIILALASRTMPRKTKKGREVFLAARGFEEYLARAERPLIEHQERQNYFEKFLPYAMVFGIAEKWARAFEGIQTEPPKWYSGESGAFHPVLFANHLDTVTRGWADTLASQPRSGGNSGGFFSGGSGFGGGFSGGGAGGGGGGGW